MLESTNNCPYLKRVDDEIRYEIAGYCERSSVCALRVPTLGELNTYCLTGDYRHCPIYRMGIAAESRGPAVDHDAKKTG